MSVRALRRAQSIAIMFSDWRALTHLFLYTVESVRKRNPAVFDNIRFRWDGLGRPQRAGWALQSASKCMGVAPALLGPRSAQKTERCWPLLTTLHALTTTSCSQAQKTAVTRWYKINRTSGFAAFALWPQSAVSALLFL